MNDEKNNSLFAKYADKAKSEKKVIFGGRLGEYRYYDMHQVVANALSLVKEELL